MIARWTGERRCGNGLSRSSQQRQDRGDEDSNRHRAQTEVVERDSAGQTGRRGVPCVHGDLSKDWGRGIRNGGPAPKPAPKPAPTRASFEENPRFLPQRPGPGTNRRNRRQLRSAHPQPTARAIWNRGVPFGLKGRNALAVPIAPVGTKNPKGAFFPLEIDSWPDGGRTGSPECDSPKQ